MSVSSLVSQDIHLHSSGCSCIVSCRLMMIHGPKGDIRILRVAMGQHRCRLRTNSPSSKRGQKLSDTMNNIFRTTVTIGKQSEGGMVDK